MKVYGNLDRMPKNTGREITNDFKEKEVEIQAICIQTVENEGSEFEVVHVVINNEEYVVRAGYVASVFARYAELQEYPFTVNFTKRNKKLYVD